MDKAEFEALVAKGNGHRLAWKDQTYRMTVTTSSKAVGRPATNYSSTMVFEYGPGTNHRFVSRSVFGDKVNPTRESLRIGHWIYSREGNERWTKKEYSDSGRTSPDTQEKQYQILTTDSQYKYLGIGSLTDTPVHVYVKTERQTRQNNNSGDTTESDVKVTYWIDHHGTILKSEYVSESRGPKVTSQTSVVTFWELDPSISFAVPEIVP